MVTMKHRTQTAIITALSIILIGCEKQSSTTQAPSRRVVVYTALDRSFSEPILNAFTEKTGIAVDALYDTEATKTIGLVNRIRAEANRPRCDVFWNNEILNTIALKNEGLLAPCHPANAQHYAAKWKDPDGYWYGFAARARILIVNTHLITDPDYPRSICDLADPTWKAKTAMAKPLFGTTATHVACLFATFSPEALDKFCTALEANDIQIQSGNKGVARAVAEGIAAFGLTDTDDAVAEVETGKPVRIVYPDAVAFPDRHNTGIQPDGTLFLPNTLAMVKDAPHPQQAIALIDYLLSADVEQRLADGPSAQIPLRNNPPPNPRTKDPAQTPSMTVDYHEAAAVFSRAADLVARHFVQ
jgi:iron(III) transport system substrate-binding protein